MFGLLIVVLCEMRPILYPKLMKQCTKVIVINISQLFPVKFALYNILLV